MKLILFLALLIPAFSGAQSGRLQDKIQAEVGPEPMALCQVGLLLQSGQVRMLPSRILRESECIWFAKASLEKNKSSAKRAILSHGNLQKEISL